MDAADQAILHRAEDAQRRLRDILGSSGLHLEALSQVAAELRCRLPRAELRRVDAALRAFVTEPRRGRAGTSTFSLPPGIRA